MKIIHVAAGGVGALIFYNLFFVTLYNGVFGPKAIDQMECSDIAEVAKTMELKNLFGASSKVLRISDEKEVSRTSAQVRCTADLMLSSGISGQYIIGVESIDGQYFYSIGGT